MSIVAIQVRFPWNTSAVRGPLSSNTWHVDSFGVTPDLANIADVANALADFYSAAWDGHVSSIVTGTMEIAAYNLDDGKPRLPFATDTRVDHLTPEADTLPGECALNIGMRYPRATGVPSQRGRGTLHLGPLSAAAITADGLATDTLMDNAEAACDALATAMHATLYEIVTGTEAKGFSTIERFSISDELGTVRRRQLPRSDFRVVAY